MRLAVQESVQSRPQLRINRAFALFVLLLTLTFLIRITNIHYNGIFVDEANNVTVGEAILADRPTDQANAGMDGSYLYPILTAIVNRTAGLEGLRILSAVLTTIAALFVFLLAQQLFGSLSALWALLIFGLSAPSINLGQIAVNEVAGVALLAIALYAIVRASLNADRTKDYYFLIAAFTVILAVLFEYIVGLYLPALLLIGLTIAVLKRRSIRPLLNYFFLPVVCILGVYIFYHQSDFITLLTGNGSLAKSESGLIIRVIMENLGIVIVLAIIGTFLLLRLTLDDSRFASTRASLFLAFVVDGLIWAILAAPLYHLLCSAIHHLEKHSVLSLIFLSPVAGYALAALTPKRQTLARGWTFAYSITAMTFTIVSLIWFVNNALDRNWGFQHSWPDVGGAVEFMRSQGLSPENRVLAEGSTSYDYYFRFIAQDHAVWYNTWFFQYSGQEGVDAMVAAIQDHYFDFVVLDGYFTPEKIPILQSALTTAGYALGYQQPPQILSSGQPISVRVYTL